MYVYVYVYMYVHMYWLIDLFISTHRFSLFRFHDSKP